MLDKIFLEYCWWPEYFLIQVVNKSMKTHYYFALNTVNYCAPFSRRILKNPLITLFITNKIFGRRAVVYWSLAVHWILYTSTIYSYSINSVSLCGLGAARAHTSGSNRSFGEAGQHNKKKTTHTSIGGGTLTRRAGRATATEPLTDPA